MLYQDFLSLLIEKIPSVDVDCCDEIIEDKALLIQRYAQSVNYKESSLLKNKMIDDLDGWDLKVGDLVTYVNDYGVPFFNYEIMGFDEFPDYGRSVFLNDSSYWFPVKPESLFKQESYIGLNESDINSVTKEYIENFVGFDLEVLRRKHVEGV